MTGAGKCFETQTEELKKNPLFRDPSFSCYRLFHRSFGNPPLRDFQKPSPPLNKEVGTMNGFSADYIFVNI